MFGDVVPMPGICILNNVANVMKTKNGQPTEPKERRVHLYSAKDQLLDLDSLAAGAGSKSPFDPSFFDVVSNWLAKHGPSLAKLLLIVGSAAGTVYNAIKASHMEGVEIGWLIMLILSAAGLIVECGFAYGWSRRGSYDLAGKQRETVDKIFNRSSYVMIGDLSLSVAEVAFGIGGIATYWIGIIQPVMAVYIVKLFYTLKGQHPEYIAEMEIVDLKANAKASQIRDAANDQKLELAEKNHERTLQWAALRKRHEHGLKLAGSRWYNRQVKQATREAVNREYLPAVRKKLGKLPKLLRLEGSSKNQ